MPPTQLQKPSSGLVGSWGLRGLASTLVPWLPAPDGWASAAFPPRHWSQTAVLSPKPHEPSVMQTAWRGAPWPVRLGSGDGEHVTT